MSVIKTFIPPDFFKGQSEDEIHARMLAALPANIDKSEGQFPWDFTRPTAQEKAEMVEFVLIEAIKNAFPMWAYGQMLDYHAQTRGMARRAAVGAKGTVTVTGTPGTVIVLGYKFATEAGYNQPVIEFEVTEAKTIPAIGNVDVPVRAVIAGIAGNVPAGAITRTSPEPLRTITKITNATATTSGLDLEDDESLRLRIVEFDYEQDVSYCGSAYDYKRWALEVQGVGAATVIPAQDDTGLVTIVITDTESNPASAELCTAVYNHIMSSDAPEARLAPVNAFLEVIAPTAVTITIEATLTVDSSTTIEAAKFTYLEDLKEYFKEAVADGEVKYSKVAAILSAIPGVLDYTGLTLNAGISNVELEGNNIPVATTETVVFT